MKKKVLVVVAHPDDETIWMGGTLLKNKYKWNTTIISLCRRDDKDRAPKFKKVCSLLGARCFMSDLEDEKLDSEQINEAVKRIKKFAARSYDYIFTHGKNGEYGHIRHVDVHRAVVKMLNEKNLSAKKIFFFSYTKKGKICCANKNSDKFIKLDNFNFQRKKKIIGEAYGFDKKGFEYLCSRDTEAFDIKNQK